MNVHKDIELTEAQAKLLADVETVAGNVRVDYDEEAPLLFAIWSDECEDIVGAGDTLDEAIDSALDTCAGWAKDVAP